MLREKPSLLQIGIALAVLGVVVKIAVLFVSLFSGLANLAILAGIILAIAGLVLPRQGRRF